MLAFRQRSSATAAAAVFVEGVNTKRTVNFTADNLDLYSIQKLQPTCNNMHFTFSQGKVHIASSFTAHMPLKSH